jgi:DNA invertase Pin-like site-specific DNA recombinase
VSGSLSWRPGLEKLKETLRKGDTLIVWRLDRMGRSLKHLIEIVNELANIGVTFKSLKESIDTSNSTGQLVFHIFASLAQFEKELVQERTRAGLEAARSRGRLGGRPKKLNKDQLQHAVKLYMDKKHSLQEICVISGITKPTLYKYVRDYR